MFLKDCVSVIRFSNTMQCEKSTEAIESCGEKCANLCRVYNLIMVSRVPGYGQFLISSTWVIACISPCLIDSVGLLITLIGIELEGPSQ